MIPFLEILGCVLAVFIALFIAGWIICGIIYVIKSIALIIEDISLDSWRKKYEIEQEMIKWRDELDKRIEKTKKELNK